VVLRITLIGIDLGGSFVSKKLRGDAALEVSEKEVIYPAPA
jgi:hypothetical protein